MASHSNQTLRHQAKKGDYERYICALLSGAPNPEPLLAVIAFHAELGKIREVTTDPVTGEMRLIWWRDAIEDLFRGTTRKHPLLEAMAPLAKDLDKSLLAAMTEARYQDLVMNTPVTSKALVETRRTFVTPFAGACMKVLGMPATEKQNALSATLGYDLVGIYRNIPFDFPRGRCLVPLDILQAHGITVEKIMAEPGSDESKHTLAAFLAAINEKVAGEAAPDFFGLQTGVAAWHVSRLVQASSDPWGLKPGRGRFSLLLALYRASRRA